MRIFALAILVVLFEGSAEGFTADERVRQLFELTQPYPGGAERKPGSIVYGSHGLPTLEDGANAALTMATKHIPVLAPSGEALENEFNIQVKHGMSEEHYIGSMFVLDDLDRVVFHVDLDVQQIPNATFSYAGDANTLQAFSWCNKHGLWMGEPVNIYERDEL